MPHHEAREHHALLISNLHSLVRIPFDVIRTLCCGLVAHCTELGRLGIGTKLEPSIASSGRARLSAITSLAQRVATHQLSLVYNLPSQQHIIHLASVATFA